MTADQAPPKKKAEHVRYVPNSGKVCCYHCGDSYQVTPASLSLVVVILKQYGKEHRRCKETDRGKDFLAANVKAFEALPPEKRGILGSLVMNEPKNLGEKIAQHLYKEELAKADLGPLRVEVKE